MCLRASIMSRSMSHEPDAIREYRGIAFHSNGNPRISTQNLPSIGLDARTLQQRTEPIGRLITRVSERM